MVYKDKLRKEITPSRLFSFLNLVNSGFYTKEELKKLMYPPALVKDQNQDFNRLFNFTNSVDLTYENNQGRVCFIRDFIDITEENEINRDSFDGFMDKILFSSDECIFNRITNSLLKKDKSILSKKNIEEFIKLVIDDVQVNTEDFLAWRFWAKYLGYAHNLADEFIIMNPFNYINKVNEIIFNENGDTNKLLFGEYLSKLTIKATVFVGSTNSNKISFPLSLALMTLHNEGKIELLYSKDSRDIWKLEGLPLSGIDQISHIVYRGDIVEQ